MNSTRRNALALAACASIAAFAMSGGSAFAQAWPSKPITIVVAYPAGGDTDAMARVFAEKLAARVGQPVIVDNKPGASGIIGSAYVAKAPADGHTLLLAPSTFSIATLVLKTSPSANYDPVQDFVPVVQTATQPLFVVASSATGVHNLKELVSGAKAKQMTYASPGSGSPMHILGEMFNKAAAVKVSHVPYRGVAPAVNDVLGGHVPLTFMTWGPVAPHVTSGKMVPLAVADAQRSRLAPNVPTLAELGYKGVEVGAWQGLLAPKGTSPEIVKTLNGHFNEILKMPDVAAKMQTFGALPAGGEPQRLAKVNADDHVRFAKIIKEFGITAD